MKVIDAFWEKRNLGVNTIEIQIEENDTVDECSSALKELETEYLVLKIPAGNIDMMFLAEKLGFHYIETSIHATHNLADITLSGIQKRMNDSVIYAPMDEPDREQLFSQIRSDMFYTDRISLDPAFSREQAQNRYIGWISDETARGSELFKIIYKEQTVGFFAFKETEKDVYYPFLAGMYKEHQTSAVGAVFNYKPMEEAKKRGAKMISTYISTNNSNAVRMHVMYGFQFREMNYVYIKHE